MRLTHANSIVRQRSQVAILLLSLALNALLLWKIRDARISARATEVASQSMARADDTSFDAPLAAVAEPLHWKKLSGLNYYALRESLLVAGCPKETVRLILETVIDREYVPKLVENFAKARSNFWNNAVLVKTPRNTPENPEEKNASRAFSALLDERDRLIQQFVRPEWDRRNMLRFEEDETDPRIAFLSENKRRLIASQRREIFDLRQNWRRADIPHGEIEEKVADLQRQHATERSGLLTREEIEEYNLRSSRFSHVVQHRYSFEPSPAERKAIIQLYEAHDGQVPEAELEKALGPDRFIRFQRAHDQTYEDTYKVGASLKLPEDLREQSSGGSTAPAFDGGAIDAQ